VDVKKDDVVVKEWRAGKGNHFWHKGKVHGKCKDKAGTRFSQAPLVDWRHYPSLLTALGVPPFPSPPSPPLPRVGVH